MIMRYSCALCGAADARARVAAAGPHVARWARALAAGSLVPGLDLDDLAQDGMLGLIDAAERFDEARGVPFETFAERRVRGAMLDALRRGAWPRPAEARRGAGPPPPGQAISRAHDRGMRIHPVLAVLLAAVVVTFSLAARQGGINIPPGGLLITTSACPWGTTRYAAADGRYLVGAGPAAADVGWPVGRRALTSREERVTGHHRHEVDGVTANSWVEVSAGRGLRVVAGEGDTQSDYPASPSGRALTTVGDVAAPYLLLRVCRVD